MQNDIELQKALCVEMGNIHERLFRAGLLKTAQKMKLAVEQIGLEVGDNIIKANEQE